MPRCRIGLPTHAAELISAILQMEFSLRPQFSGANEHERRSATLRAANAARARQLGRPPLTCLTACPACRSPRTTGNTTDAAPGCWPHWATCPGSTAQHGKDSPSSVGEKTPHAATASGSGTSPRQRLRSSPRTSKPSPTRGDRSCTARRTNPQLHTFSRRPKSTSTPRKATTTSAICPNGAKTGRSPTAAATPT